MNLKRIRQDVLKIPIDVVSWDNLIQSINQWTNERSSRYICICNVHSVVTAQRNTQLREAIFKADIATPDGGPIAWMLRKYGHTKQDRINGPDLMWRYCNYIEHKDETIFLYGGSTHSLSLLTNNLISSYPKLKIAGTFSPPYRQLTDEEDKEIIHMINESGASIVWVGLGCPKQELWMSAHHGKIKAVMVGVGAAFDYHAGVIKRAPIWMQNNSLEWFYRMISEPKRLMRRYLVTNTIFIIGALNQLLSK